MRRRRGAVVALLLAASVPAVAGCGSSGSSSPASSSGSAPASASASAGPAFNPCDSLHARRISRVLGAKVTITRGTADTPRCALLPARKGGPTFEMSYLWFDGGLDRAWQTMKVPAGATTSPVVPGADAARMVVQQDQRGYLVSAFLQNGPLIQSLNGVALPPYRVARMQRATAEILAELSAGAPRQ